MNLFCINKYGWYQHKGNYYGFLEPSHPSEIEGPHKYGIYHGTSTIVDHDGDLCYVLEGFGECGWDAECFVQIEEQNTYHTWETKEGTKDQGPRQVTMTFSRSWTTQEGLDKLGKDGNNV